MTEWERWMDEHPPLSEPLDAEAAALLERRVLARRPKLRKLPGVRLAAAAAALCLVAAGAAVLGFFRPMSRANEADTLVKRYGTVLQTPVQVEIGGHTVTVQALLRGQDSLRVLYEVGNAAGMTPDDLLWCDSRFTWLPPKEGEVWSVTFTDPRSESSLRDGLAVGDWEGRYTTGEDTMTCFVDIPQRSTAGPEIKLYVGDVRAQDDDPVEIALTMPDPARSVVTIETDVEITLKGGENWFHYDMSEADAAAYPDSTFHVESVTVEPLEVTIAGRLDGAWDGFHRYDFQSWVRLYTADGTELTYGWDGEFYQASYAPDHSGLKLARISSYDILDPDAVAYVMIGGQRFDAE